MYIYIYIYIYTRTKIWIEINEDSPGTYNINSQITLKTTLLKLSLCIIVMHIWL